MDWEIALLWRELIVVLYSLVGSTSGQHDKGIEIGDVWFMFLIPEEEVTTLYERLLGWRVLARYWEHILGAY